MKNLNKVWAKIPKMIKYEMNVLFVSVLYSTADYLSGSSLTLEGFVRGFIPAQILSSLIVILRAVGKYQENNLDKTKKVVKK